MRNIKDEHNLNQKKVLLRLDLNVPLSNGKITDTTRIDKILPTIKFLLESGANIIILSHVGRPNGKVVNRLSLKPICEDLKNKLNENIKLISKNIKEIKSTDLFNEHNEKIVILENIRFYEEEEKNDNSFAKHLASLADIYINDAFSCSHRQQASIHKITKYIKECYAGPLLKKEVEAINLVIKDKKKPVTCIIGGSKVSSKINVISNLIKNVENIVIVGAMANNFLAYNGIKVGKSLTEKDTDKIIDNIYVEAKKYNCNILIPEDFNVSDNFANSGDIKKENSISENEMILDIGPKTIENIEKIIDQSNTVLWNGPAGYFENENFSIGTLAIAKKISENTAKKSLISVIGGGDTISALNKSKNDLAFTHLSTAGGAFLEFLEGKDLPGLDVLK